MIRFLNKDIKNILPKLCINCKYFIGDEVRWPDQNPDHINLGRCKLFGKYDLITGDTKYDFAYSVRNDNDKCGETGKLFTENDDV